MADVITILICQDPISIYIEALPVWLRGTHASETSGGTRQNSTSQRVPYSWNDNTCLCDIIRTEYKRSEIRWQSICYKISARSRVVGKSEEGRGQS